MGLGWDGILDMMVVQGSYDLIGLWPLFYGENLSVISIKIRAQDYHTNWSPWHHRMVHILPEAVRHLVSEREIEGIEIDESTQLQSCDSCEYANATQKPIRKIHKTPRASEFGE